MSRVGQHCTIGMATERSATTRLKGGSHEVLVQAEAAALAVLALEFDEDTGVRAAPHANPR